MTTLSENTKFTGTLVGVLLSLAVGGASWVTYITWEVKAMREDIAWIKGQMGGPTGQGSSGEAVASGR